MPTDKTYLYALWQKVCTNSDQQAFQARFELLYLRLANFGVAYVHNREPAEEIVGDVFLKLWMNRAATGEITHAETYLFTAVRHQSLNYQRKFSTYHVVDAAKVSAVAKRDTDFENLQPGKHNLLPIPQSELDINVQLHQNLNW